MAALSGSAGPVRTVVRRRRPPAVTILAVIQLLTAFGYGAVFVALLAGDSAILDTLGIGPAFGDATIAAVERSLLTAGVGVISASALVGGILLLRMRRLGWTIAMLLTGFGLATSIYGWFADGHVSSLWLLIQVVTVFYLNQRQVREAFGISGRVGRETPEASRG